MARHVIGIAPAGLCATIRIEVASPDFWIPTVDVAKPQPAISVSAAPRPNAE